MYFNRKIYIVVRGCIVAGGCCMYGQIPCTVANSTLMQPRMEIGLVIRRVKISKNVRKNTGIFCGNFLWYYLW